MRIDNTITSSALERPDNLSTTPAAPQPTTVASDPASAVHTPAQDLLSLQNNLRQIPELRQELVREVAQRLATGELLTQAALDETVKSILEGQGVNA
jgi:hypothetical protein